VLPEVTDRGHRRLDRVMGLRVEHEGVPPGLGERLRETERVLDHQVDIEGLVRSGPDRPDQGRAEGDVRDEVPVHYVQVEGIGPARLRLPDRPPEVREVRAQEAGREAAHPIP